MTWSRSLLLLFTFFISHLSLAYIPEYSLIAARTAEQHGSGVYQIEQDVQFRKDTEVFTIRETWLIANENVARVKLEGRGSLKGQVQGTLVFDSNRKVFINTGAQIAHSQRLGDEWLEPLFYFRNSKYLRTRLVNLKIAPPESLQDRSPLSTKEVDGSNAVLNYTPPGFIRFSRVGGTVAWAIGVPPSSTELGPTLWIEQDQFVIRKIRGPSQVVVKANDYGKFDETMWFPRQRSYNFGSYTVEIKTDVVKSLGKARPNDPRFLSKSLNPAHDTLNLPEVPALKEFYARFR